MWAAHCMIASARLALSLDHVDARQCAAANVAQEFIGRRAPAVLGYTLLHVVRSLFPYRVH